MSVYAQVQVAEVKVVALDRMGGHSVAPYASLNVADYVGDRAESVALNLSEVASYFGATEIAVMSAQHGNQVCVASQGGKCEPADVIVTTTPGLVLLALAADCVPFALMDVSAGVVAVVHVGWRGLLANVIDAALDALRVNGAHPQHTVAVIGPSICGSCYEVSAELAEQISTAHPVASVDDHHVDLARAVQAHLENSGVQVERMDGCTFEDEKLFSYRRAAGSPTGRGGLAVMLPGQGVTHG